MGHLSRHDFIDDAEMFVEEIVCMIYRLVWIIRFALARRLCAEL